MLGIKKFIFLFCSITFLFSLPLLAGKITEKDLIDNLPPDQKLYYLAVATLSRPFLQDSPDVIKEKSSLYQFFSQKIYEKLKGNYFLGYIYDEGFSFAGDEIQLDIVKGTYKTKKFLKAFKEAGRISAGKNKIKLVKNSSYGIGVALVGVQFTKTKSSLPGVMLEVYLTNRKTGKTLFYRFGTGNKGGLDKAMIDAWDIIFNIVKNCRGKNEGK